MPAFYAGLVDRDLHHLLGHYPAEDLPPTSTLARSIHEFLSDWLKELHAQGFATPSPDEAKRRADALAAYLRDQG